ncbi:MAG: OsmC family protein [Cytophagaceae bacterium]|nr:OsmC family protein [Cytophagaceae bacterium]
MHQMTSEYLGELRSQATHLSSGTTILTDAPLDNQGKGEAFSPTDLVCASLSACMMTIMGIVARREQLDLVGLRAEITKVMAADPRRIASIAVHFHLPEGKVASLSEKQKEVLKRAAHTCPVALSLHPDIRQEIQFNF